MNLYGSREQKLITCSVFNFVQYIFFGFGPLKGCGILNLSARYFEKIFSSPEPKAPGELIV